MQVRTSTTHPIRVDFVPLEAPGRLGMTFAPGKKQLWSLTGGWQRDLELDLRELRENFGADLVVSLLEPGEPAELGIPDLPEAAAHADLELLSFAIDDGGVPTDVSAYLDLITSLARRVAGGRTVVIFCKGGLGRTGTTAACVLVALGIDPDRAVRLVRETRPGTVEAGAQETFVLAFAS